MNIFTTEQTIIRFLEMCVSFHDGIIYVPFVRIQLTKSENKIMIKQMKKNKNAEEQTKEKKKKMEKIRRNKKMANKKNKESKKNSLKEKKYVKCADDANATSINFGTVENYSQTNPSTYETRVFIESK